MSEFRITLTQEQFNRHKHHLDDFVFHRKVEDGVEVKTTSKYATEYLKKITKWQQHNNP